MPLLGGTPFNKKILITGLTDSIQILRRVMSFHMRKNYIVIKQCFGNDVKMAHVKELS
jgi:hypothetical protein